MKHDPGRGSKAARRAVGYVTPADRRALRRALDAIHELGPDRAALLDAARGAVERHRTVAALHAQSWKGGARERAALQREARRLRQRVEKTLAALAGAGPAVTRWGGLAAALERAEEPLANLAVELGEMERFARESRAATREPDPADEAAGEELLAAWRATGRGSRGSAWASYLGAVLRVAKGDPAFDGTRFARRLHDSRPR